MTEIQMEPNKNENSGNITQAQQILSLIDRSKAVLFHDEFNEPYARVRVDDHFELCKIRSRNFTRWLTHRYWGKFNQVPNKESLNSACSVIEARACFEGEKHNLHNRTASHDGSIWYDLGNWKAVKVSSDGWEIINDPPILFRTYSHQKAQAEPVRCPSYEFDRILEELSSLINIKDYNLNHKERISRSIGIKELAIQQ